MAPKTSRREFVKKAGYVAPVILTLTATPALAARGSAGPEYPDQGGGIVCGNRGRRVRGKGRAKRAK